MASKRAAATLVAQLPKIQPVLRSRPFLQSATRTTTPILPTIRQRYAFPQLRHQSTNSLPDLSATQAQPNPSESSSATQAQPNPSESSDSSTPVSPADRIKTVPHYEIVFTCKPCGTRSKHRISKQGYHHGSILISCPGCRNRHVISDHLRIFGDRAVTVEDLMKERGQLVKKGTLGEDGDLEFWEDGSVTERNADSGEEHVKEAKDRKEEEEGKESWRDSAPGSTFKNGKE